MWYKKQSIKRVFITLWDIGVWRLCLRLRYEFFQKLDKKLPFFLAINLTKGTNNIPKFIPFPKGSYDNNIPYMCYLETEPKDLSFCFLNIRVLYTKEIFFKNLVQSRLWQFNLHYFDWARVWLDNAIDAGNWTNESIGLGFLIDNWISSSHPNNGDGWHSYTTSLRIRNWLWIFQSCPELANEKRIKYLWWQICWLKKHPESCHGGNHWLENLISLAVVTLQFDGSYSSRINRYAIVNLRKELESQILLDGGHEERSASYHILILDRLLELGCLLEIYKKSRPKWLEQSIQKMTIWLEVITLANGDFPKFNDCSKDSCPPLETVYLFAQGFLNKLPSAISGLRSNLLKKAYGTQKILDTNIGLPEFRKLNQLSDLPETGWTFLRPGGQWEIAFKCGNPCPSHLGAHAHSDQLSFDMWHKGTEVIAETGTSTYDPGRQRDFERSSAAHNTLQLGYQINNTTVWIEPVDVWGVFRAGRKARPLARSSGEKNNWLWAQGSHDGFHEIDCEYFRWIGIRLDSESFPILCVIDVINNRKLAVNFKSRFHFGPDFNKRKDLSKLSWSHWSSSSSIRKSSFRSGYLAKSFGNILSRDGIEIMGDFHIGKNYLVSILARPTLDISCDFHNSFSGKISINKSDSINWTSHKGPFEIIT